jgi:sulfide:quinone oxidoreductase
MRAHVVVLGAGFGGLELVTRLSEAVADEARITLIDQSEAFMFGFSKLDVMFGRRPASDVWIPYRHIDKPGVEFRQETVRSIDPDQRRVVTDGGTYDADILVVALGADYDVAATPGLEEGGYEFYSTAGAERARDALAAFGGGAVVVGVLGPLFKCPGAPNETALLVDDFLSARGLRGSSTIHLVTPMPMPIPISQRTSAAIRAILEDHGIEYWPSSLITHLDAERHIAHLGDGRELPYDLFLGIPVHRAPDVVLASPLAEDGWIPVDPTTFATKFPGVFAVGDVTSAPVPRAGAIAEGEAATVAEVLIAQLTGGSAPPPYDGAAACYVEMGDHLTARIDVNFLSYDLPVARFTAPTVALSDEKQEWGATRAERWFGREQSDTPTS